MPNFCAAPNCSRKSTNCPDIPFFRFPKDPERDTLTFLSSSTTDSSFFLAPLLHTNTLPAQFPAAFNCIQLIKCASSLAPSYHSQQ
eukprot:g43400.t1